jgi:2,3-bisphosphoglycerate-dependent phosphoglycerate mutase
VTNLYFIRHGEAVSNVEPVVAGMRGDAGLTAKGISQAERLRDRLAATGEIAADVFIASTLPRARQTAEIIAPSIGQPIQWDDEVQEIRVGEADGLTIAELDARYGRPDFASDPYRPLAPGGESWAEFLLRADTALRRIAREHEGKTVVVVCHGGIVDASFGAFLALSPLAYSVAGFLTRNTSITHWSRRQMGERPHRWRLECYNDAMHLSEHFQAGRSEPDTSHPAVPLASEE